MLERIEGNGVHTIIVETANRFARDLMVQAHTATSRKCATISPVPTQIKSRKHSSVGCSSNFSPQ
jgi:hypothetical protein